MPKPRCRNGRRPAGCRSPITSLSRRAAPTTRRVSPSPSGSPARRKRAPPPPRNAPPRPARRRRCWRGSMMKRWWVMAKARQPARPAEPTPVAAADTRCGYVALIGAPNAGKSTLLNRLVGHKLAIVTPKPQTTRNRLLGIAIENPAQIVFVDTPGIFAPRRRLDRAMVAAAWSGAEDADEALLLVDAARGVDQDTRRILDRLRDRGRRSILALNKIDLVPREGLLGLAITL